MPTQNRPRNQQDQINELVRRVRALESRQTVSIGPWVIEVRDSDEALIVRNARSGSVKEIADDGG